MTEKQYKSLTRNDMKTKRYRLNRQVGNYAGSTLAKGTEIKLELKRSGFNIRSVECPHCGAKVGIRKIHWLDVDEITE